MPALCGAATQISQSIDPAICADGSEGAIGTIGTGLIATFNDGTWNDSTDLSGGNWTGTAMSFAAGAGIFSVPFVLPAGTSTVTTPVWSGDSWAIADTLTGMDLFTGLWSPQTSSGRASGGLQPGAMSRGAGWCPSRTLATCFGVTTEEPDWIASSGGEPVYATTPANFTDGPKAAFDATSGAVVIADRISSAMSPSNGEIDALIFNPCGAAPGSPACSVSTCVNMAPGVPDLAHVRCDSGIGNAGALHSAVAAFDGEVWVFYMANSTSGTLMPTLAVYRPGLSPSFLSYPLFTFAIPPGPRGPGGPKPLPPPRPPTALDCPLTLSGGACTPSCGDPYPGCSSPSPCCDGRPVPGIPLTLIPQMASGYDASSNDHLLYLAWNASPVVSGVTLPIIGIYVLTFAVDDSVWPPHVSLRNGATPENRNHDEYLPALAADPGSGKVVLFFYSDADANLPGVDPPANACAGSLMACPSGDGGGGGLPGSAVDLRLGCTAINRPNGATGGMLLAPVLFPGSRLALTDYIFATTLDSQRMIASWVEPEPNPLGCCAGTLNTGFQDVAFANWVDPPLGCADAEREREEGCAAASSGDDSGEGDEESCKERAEQDGEECRQAEREREAEEIAERNEEERAAGSVTIGSLPPIPVPLVPSISLRAPSPPPPSPPPTAGSLNAPCASSVDCSAALHYACNGGFCGCPGGFGLCGLTCVDVAVDPSNCGRCGTACAAGEVCTDGVCR